MAGVSHQSRKRRGIHYVLNGQRVHSSLNRVMPTASFQVCQYLENWRGIRGRWPYQNCKGLVSVYGKKTIHGIRPSNTRAEFKRQGRFRWSSVEKPEGQGLHRYEHPWPAPVPFR